MKTLINLIITSILVLATMFAEATERPEPVKFFKAESIIDHYLDATQHGNTELVDHLFTSDFYYSTPNNRSKESLNRKAMTTYLKSLKGVKLDCTSTYQFIEKNDDCSIVKVTTEFEKFKRNDYITLCNSKDGWKISNVIVTYP